MISIEECEETKVTRVKCPLCGERVPHIGLMGDSSVRGLTFRCTKCKRYFAVKTSKPTRSSSASGKEICHVEKE